MSEARRGRCPLGTVQLNMNVDAELMEMVREYRHQRRHPSLRDAVETLLEGALAREGIGPEDHRLDRAGTR